MSTAVIPGTCPHCGAANESNAAFCESCGKALPAGLPTSPRIVSGKEVATTGLGQMLQSDQLQKEARKAAGALLAVAILQAVFATVILMIARSASRGALPPEATNLLIVLYGVAAIFFGLYLWARKQPLPAAIVGLVLYLTLLLMDAIADPEQILRGVIVKIIIITMLSKAIKAGIQHRNLLKHQPGQ